MGKTSGYVANGASRGSVPQADTLAAMLAVCGFSLVAMPSDEVPPSALVIDPPAVDRDEVERAALERKRARLRRELAALDDALIG